MIKHILICIIFCVPYAAYAFDVLPIDTFYNPVLAQNSAWASLNYANTLSEIAAQPPSGGGSNGSSSGGGSKSTKVPVGTQRGIKGTINRLTSLYPADTRPQAKRVFNELYRGYGQFEKRFGIPKNDLAGAVATYIAGNYSAYRDIDVPDADFKALSLQMRQALRSNRVFRKLKPLIKRSLYEQFSILGLFPALTRLALQEQPNADVSLNLQDAARRNLEALLNISADRLAITPEGLVIF